MRALLRSREKVELVLAGLLLASLGLTTPRIAESDAIQYFAYLRSGFFDRDLDFTNEYTYFYLEDPEGRRGFKETFLERESRTGRKLNFGPIGSALLWSPSYLVAHGGVLLARSLGAAVPADGYAQPYRLAVALSSALYAAAGLLLAYRLARRYAAPEVSFIAVVTLWWATPVAYYMYIAPGMSHSSSLFAVALFFTLWSWAARGSIARWAAWGASAGLMALVREQDVFFAVAALPAVLSPRLDADFRGRALRLLVFGAGALAVFSPQLAVYQVLNGQPTPSPHVQNKLIWSSPHFFQVLFSPEHGLFFWSPALVLFLAGGAFLFWRDRETALTLGAAFLAQVYISGAVDSWTMAGAFGARRFVSTTVIFAVWGAALLRTFRSRMARAGLAAASSFFILWNLFLMIQFGLGLMDRQRLVWREVVHNQFFEVPPRLISAASRYFLARDELLKREER